MPRPPATVNPSSDLVPWVAYSILIDGDAITDVSGNTYSGIASAGTLNFLTRDKAPPTLVDASPAHEASGVALSASIILTFSEDVHAGIGTIDLVRTATRVIDRDR
ncbi:MAG: hypothetical protein EXQ93_00380 [Alphaproteobacteria bacterium]|nr:hypothetical protein [Alphaproteobacteria bacterium]